MVKDKIIDKQKLNNILVGTDFDSIEDAIAADLVSAVPLIGGVSDFLRLLDSESRPQKALQAFDMLTSPLPFADIATPTNTLVFLDKRGMLPVKLDKIDSLLKKPFNSFNKIALLKNRNR